MIKVMNKIALIISAIFVLFNILRDIDSNVPPILGNMSLTLFGGSVNLNGLLITDIISLLLIIFVIYCMFSGESDK